MKLLDRRLEIDLPEGQSAFLWGLRKTGKSTYLAARFSGSAVFDLLDTDLFFELSKRPGLFREQVLALDRVALGRPIVVDEAQKVPAILDEVHRLIENEGLRFMLCGSSARKLVRGGANLLGGRAWRFEMHPLVTDELGDWKLIDVLNRGLVPAHYLRDGYTRALAAYTRDYLKEEIVAEGLTRNIPAFSRFMDAMAFSHGELVNYSNIARECGVDGKTVKEYFRILVDTLMGRLLEPYKKRRERQAISRAPKFYLFDVGVAGALTKRRIVAERGEAFGRALEHFVLMELVAHASYSGLDYDINFWRTKTGHEVDFVLARGEIAVEVKGSARVDNRDLKPIRTFVDIHSPARAIVACNERRSRRAGDIEIMPVRRFLKLLWAGEIVS